MELDLLELASKESSSSTTKVVKTDPDESEARSSKKGKPKRAGRKPAKNEIFCVGCAQYVKSDMFQMNQCYCVSCKRLLDRISKQSERQGESSWFSSQKRCPKKLKAMLDHMRALVNKAGASKVVRFAAAEFREFHRTEASTECYGRGRLMWEEQV